MHIQHHFVAKENERNRNRNTYTNGTNRGGGGRNHQNQKSTLKKQTISQSSCFGVGRKRLISGVKGGSYRCSLIMANKGFPIIISLLLGKSLAVAVRIGNTHNRHDGQMGDKENDNINPVSRVTDPFQQNWVTISQRARTRF